MDWRPNKKRPRGRPPERWTNNIKRTAGKNWQQVANGSFKMKRKWGGLHPAVDRNRLKKKKQMGLSAQSSTVS